MTLQLSEIVRDLEEAMQCEDRWRARLNSFRSYSDNSQPPHLTPAQQSLIRIHVSDTIGSRHSQVPIPLQPSKALDNLFPPETLSEIFGHLTSSHDIHAVRLTCSKFEKAAWPAFATSFNDRIFHPTGVGILCLSEFANNPRAAPYLKCLQLSTAVVNEVGVREFATRLGRGRCWCTTCCGAYGHGVSFYTRQMQAAEAVKEYESYYRSDMRLRQNLHTLFAQALWKLKKLENIIVVDGKELTYPPRWPFLSHPTQAIVNAESDFSAPYSSLGINIYDMHAHSHTLNLLFDGLERLTNLIPQHVEVYLPRLRSLSIVGRMDLESLSLLPSQRNAHGVGALGSITDLDVAVTDESRVPYTLHNAILAAQSPLMRLTDYLPCFLRNFNCEALRSLGLNFPRPADGLIPNLRVESAFREISTRIRFANLENVHIAHLRITNPQVLCSFLLAVRTSLKTLRLTGLRFSPSYHISFMHFLHGKMELDEVCFASDLSKEEKDIEASASYPHSLRPTLEDFRMVAKVTKIVELGLPDIVLAREQKIKKPTEAEAGTEGLVVETDGASSSG